ncbi:hypothetical protein MIT9_P1513 [Methylomarinovum caldicuralii]|uniref:DUF3047 domain-containing protein n=1 Tax=Methylomarinovum caldicuralii TaxID=438856 RepID=A0AAU9CJW9_9GAMM|nr:DUF3047 domain-containing protein [Methylomarinovum caldicuralii]BCX81931.1 hypothetical protein MIT9_P1513 [Methylomarinovum caldicuralii]
MKRPWPMLLFLSAALAEPTVDVGVFTQAAASPPPPWHVVTFAGRPPTRYRIRPWDGEMAIEAISEAGMALLARPIDVDLDKTPVLCWRWRIDTPVAGADLSRKSGDDYAARVYVAFRLPPESLDWFTRSKLALARRVFGKAVPDAALNYVWDNRHPPGTMRPNAYTERAMMIVVESGAPKAGRWVSEARNVRIDARRAFGDLPFEAVLLAVAADSDDTGGHAHAGFARLCFVARPEQCGRDDSA